MRQKWPDALSAIRWACSVAGNPGRPYSSRMLDAWREGGDSTDAAAQAGIIFRVLWELRGAPMATLVARAVRMSVPCECRRECCSGRRLNADWKEAIEVLTTAALTEAQAQDRARRSLESGEKGEFPLAPLAGALGAYSYPFRLAIMQRIFGQHMPYHQVRAALPGDEAVKPAIAILARYGKEVELWLGERSNGEVVNEAGIAPKARVRATELLRAAGLLDAT